MIVSFRMNVKLRELDNAARIWAMENTNFPISSHIPPGYTEKLAELIVKECADISYKIAWNDLVRGESGSVIPLHIYNSINEHFGVE